MTHSLSPKIRTTVGWVLRYSADKRFGFIKIHNDNWKDAFVSYREVEANESGIKKLTENEYVEFDLHQNDKGYVAMNVRRITEQQFNNRVESENDSRYNKESYSHGNL